MEILYRLATIDDLDSVLQLVESAVNQMGQEKIIVVVYAINEQCDEQHKNGKWQYIGENYKIIHRLCVSPDCQNKGIAQMTLIHIEEELKSLGVKAIRLDVFCENPYALKLYMKNGYQKTGVACWRKGKFLLMEKRI